MELLLPLLLLCSLLSVCGQQQPQSAAQTKRKMDPLTLEEFCRNFTVGNPREQEFFSPNYPREYPPDITCFRTITAPVGYFVRLDFRDRFRIEPKSTNGKCDYDYLEIRDGDQGYSPSLGKFCGNDFPHLITSSGRSLWMRFHSDSTIQYHGFRAVYTFVENPLDPITDIGRCAFQVSGSQEEFGTSDITQSRKNHSILYDVPLDCVWTVQAQEGFKIYMQFSDYDLENPNNCNLNFIQVFDGKTDEEFKRHTFCGSVPESYTSTTSTLFVRFYAETMGLKSTFTVVTTAIKSLEDGQSCDLTVEYDCEDASCISQELLCNGVRNCKFGWDEESCPGTTEEKATLDLTSSHVVLILVALIFIVLAMCAGMVWNLHRQIRGDKEELTASREKSLAGASVANLPPPPMPPTVPPMMSSHKSLTSRAASAAATHADSNGGCYVPDAGYPLPHDHHHRGGGGGGHEDIGRF